MVDNRELYNKMNFQIDFGLKQDKQIVQKELYELVQFDSNSGLLVFDFYNKERKIDLSGVRIIINFQFPSGRKVQDEVIIIRNLESRAMYFTPSGVLQEIGTVIGDVSLFKNTTQLTSPIRFKFNVIEGVDSQDIVDHSSYPILVSLINQVDTVIDKANLWDEKFSDKYTEVGNSINLANQQFIEQKQVFEQKFIDNIGLQNTTFDTKYNAIDTQFTQKYNEIDVVFNQTDINAMFQDKFVRLEQDYAQDYTDMKQTVKEIYGTTLRYRIVE